MLVAPGDADTHQRRRWQTRREAGAQSQGSLSEIAQLPILIQEVKDKEVPLPYVTSWPHKRVLALVAACFALAVAAQPAAAATINCPTLSSSTVFSALGDNANYTPVSGGTFEGDMSGWTLNSASVVSGNEPWQVDGSGDDQSLSIAAGGSATSPMFCVTSLTPSWRFFANAANGSSSSVLHVSALATLPSGHVIQVPITNLSGSGYSSWAATPSLLLGRVLPPGVTIPVRFVFAADSDGGAWSIDDVFVDPYAK